MPLALTITFLVMVGWPALKLATTLVSRPLWRAQKELRGQLLDDYGSHAAASWEKRIIVAEFDVGKGELVNLLLPFVAFFGGLIAVFATAKARSAALASREGAVLIERSILSTRYPLEAGDAIDRLVADWRFRCLMDRAFDLALLRFPIASALTILALLPAIFVYLLVTGLWTSATRIGKNMIEASQSVLSSFFIFAGRFPCQ